MAHNLPYYGYYKYGVIPWLDTGLLCKNSSHATTPPAARNDDSGSHATTPLKYRSCIFNITTTEN
ncbi:MULTISPECIES: hypothetical protein [unclassified Rickettsia]|uniref:hypothetical protein n=1 Tax=unclassified Rickettsia TaxID=114295 RepID=UPI0031330844